MFTGAEKIRLMFPVHIKIFCWLSREKFEKRKLLLRMKEK